MSNKILKLSTLKKKIEVFHNAGKKVVFTNGCFDILHYGHTSYLQMAKKYGNTLIVGLNSDVSIRRIKGKNRPIVSQEYRMGVLAALECVDYIIIFNEDTPLNVIKQIKPDILVKGADWKGKTVIGSDVVRSYGGKVKYITFVKGCSTTKIIKDIIKKCS